MGSLKITYEKNAIIITHPSGVIQKLSVEDLRRQYEELQTEIGDITERKMVIQTQITEAELAS